MGLLQPSAAHNRPQHSTCTASQSQTPAQLSGQGCTAPQSGSNQLPSFIHFKGLPSTNLYQQMRRVLVQVTTPLSMPLTIADKARYLS
jgi:hypothetical protein